MTIHMRDAASPAAMAAVLSVGFTPTRPLRIQIEDQIEALITLLDSLEDDPDLEPTFGHLGVGQLDECEPAGDEEPWLGSSEGLAGQRLWDTSDTSDRELDAADWEPSLGAPETVRTYSGPLGLTSWSRERDRSTSQARWAVGCQDDREDEHDGREDGADDEPSLGSLGSTAGTCDLGEDAQAWAGGGTDDREGPDDNGIADADGLSEQVGMRLAYHEGERNRAAAREAERQLHRMTGRAPARGGSTLLVLGLVSPAQSAGFRNE